MLSLTSASLSFTSNVVPSAGRVARAGAIMKGDVAIVLADKAVESKIMAVVDETPSNRKSAAMCSQMGAANFQRMRSSYEEGGVCPQGPPGTVCRFRSSILSTRRSIHSASNLAVI